MFSGFFNYDNPIWRFIGKFGDLIILNILWFFCSLPIFTIGASTTAVYYVTLKLARDDDGYTIRSFFKSFRENFRQATVIWLIMLVIGAVLGFDVYFFAVLRKSASTSRTIMLAVFMAMLIIYVFVNTYIFALQARFYNTIKRTFFNAFYMSVRHILHTIAILAVDLALLYLAIRIPQVLMLLMLFGFPLVAFINSYILAPVLKKYMPEEEDRGDQMRPLFADEDMEAKKKEASAGGGAGAPPEEKQD